MGDEHWQKLYTDRNGRLLLLAVEQLNGNWHAIVEFWAGRKLVSRPDGTVLRVVRASSNEDMNLAVLRGCIQEDLTK